MFIMFNFLEEINSKIMFIMFNSLGDDTVGQSKEN